MKDCKIFLIILISLFLFSCKGKISNLENEVISIETQLENQFKKSDEDKEYENYIVLDSVTNSWVNSLKNISKTYKSFDIDLKLTKNKNVIGVIDTMKIMKFDKTQIIVYSTTNFYGICSAEIYNKEFALWNYIRIGMKKYQLEKTFPRRMISDTIQIGNLEHTSFFEFHFVDGILKRIKYEGYVD